MIVTLTIVRYKPLMVPFALLAMAVHRLPLSLNPSCRFWKLVGCGRNGTFDLQPDWQQWGLLAVWDTPADFEKNDFINWWWKTFTTESWTLWLEPMSSHGHWDGEDPFGKEMSAAPYNGPIGVLTRATIRLNKLRAFWKNVQPVAEIMSGSPGYITSVGIGEAPFFRQATFSIWENLESMKAFAYNSIEHREVIKKTREGNWYSEELFARFRIVKTTGSLNGNDPVVSLLKIKD